MTTGDELLLLAMVPGWQRIRIRIRSFNRLRYALRISELAELCQAGRTAVGRRRIEVLDTRPVEDRRLNNVLQGLGAATPPHSLKDWLRRTPRSLTVEYLSRLEDQKAVRVRRWRDSSGRTRNDILSLDMPRRQALLTRLDSVVRSGSARSTADRDVTLAVLAQAAGLAPAAYPGLRGIIDRRRMAALAATHRLTPAAAGAVPVADVELAEALTTGADVLTRQLLGELSDLYADFTTGGHDLGHGLDSGGWSEGGAGGTGHHGDGHADW
ncbi:GPP34 family phosphoprotein [Streptomyces sp. NPDC005775]|uniref:GOLPH3/VPS74 family protein n=1 Tax=unclassified Streptomyces TaxID=2593676 RepID=UPI0033C58658